jgi:cell division protease FtsH
VIDEEIHALIDGAYTTAKGLLTTNIDKLHFIADYLLSHEEMDGDQFKAVMEGEALTAEALEEMAAKKAEESRAANAAKAEENAAKAKADADASAAAAAEGDFSDPDNNDKGNITGF